MMETIMVSAACGVMNSLLRKLATLLEKEYMLLKDVKHNITFLRNELASMNLLLFKLADIEDLDVQVKEWRNKVRELAYDIEDCIDNFMVNDRPNRSLIRKTIGRIKKLWFQHDIGKQIQELRTRVVEESDRRYRYKLDDSTFRPEMMEIDHRLKALYVDTNKLEGIDSPVEQIIQWLTGNGKHDQELNIMAIVGFGGLGKTTLAMQVYNKFKDKFDCTAFVSVSRGPNIKKVLMDLLKDVGAAIDTTDDEMRLINKLKGHLTKKRYFVVIDDLWDVSAWSFITCAFHQNNRGSRIIITTRKIDVAKACCLSSGDHIYEMQPLSVAASERLFFKRIFGSEERCPSHLKEASIKILRKCGGLPLAIITVSSLLASKDLTLDQWNRVANSIGSTLENNPDIEVMRKILSISYFDLPHYLKTCLLYISIFPEDYIINRKSLIVRWINEGFVQEEYGKNAHDIGESYFNELINRRLVQPWFIDHDSGSVVTCRVHDMILDLIITKSVEENFVTLLDSRELTSSPQNKIRRLSIQCGDGEPPALVLEESTSLSHVRSVTIFGHGKQLPSLSNMKALRVLDLEGCKGLENHHLENIERLIHLKYLNLRETEITELPKQVVKLQYLDTLDIRNTGVSELPPAIIQLRQLARLFIDLDTRLPYEIGKMQNLEELTHVNTCMYHMNFLKKLAQLSKLRELEISWDHYGTRVDKVSYAELPSSYLASCSFCTSKTPLRHEQQRTISKVPTWVGSLVNLQELSFRITKMTQDDLDVLGDIPALRSLAFHMEICTKTTPWEDPRPEDWLRIRKGFQSLNSFRFECGPWEWMCLIFEAGSMPKLEILDLEVPSVENYLIQKLGFDLGINNLSCISTVTLRFSNRGCSQENEVAIRKSVSIHRNRPALEIIRKKARS
ncbi:Disease resistance RPP13-like protein 4 [Zea mays]|uniref:Disease resistance RPP13-like protein 4 n=3 Tax=Zea mays TaxID=4577 RepID=A0A1D6HS45_MAIZE|nr:Disease resistance RPP13-like protein 4 [Zea mays]ONM51284.1 Disease resistance RPP13-like protein 4 [Zea mays]ONM51285.1 Disease resistance RPP13-like protein 4 [Zea mays]ONM51286.1 Disease resistance RPP13-like protein 4 [Zea mays]